MAAQQDEVESMAAIFADDFTLLSQEPLSYSIRLRMMELSAFVEECNNFTVADASLRSPSR